MNIQTLPNGTILDMDSVHYIQSEFLRPCDVIPSKLIISYENAEITLRGTKKEIEDTHLFILQDISRRVEERIRERAQS